jgi:hypothetical protein
MLIFLVLMAPAGAAAQGAGGATGGGVLDLSALAALEAMAAETVTISLDPSTMDLAKAFLSGQHALEEAAALEVIEGLESLQVRVFEFSGENAYSPSDVAPIYDQLRGPNWSQLLSADEEDERVGAWVFRTGDAVGGVALVVEEEDELVVVNIVGTISLEDLIALGSHFDLPFLPEMPQGDGAPTGDDDPPATN